MANGESLTACPEIPSLQELLRGVRNIPNVGTSAGFSGAIDGGRTAGKFYEHLLEQNPGMDASSFIDSFEIPGLDMCLPLSTAIVQTFKQGALCYQGHIDAGTAVARIACSAICVGSGAGVGSVVGTVLLPGLGTLIGGLIGGYLGGRTSKAIIESDFQEKRDCYLRARAEWERKIENSRFERNSQLRAFYKTICQQRAVRDNPERVRAVMAIEFQRHLQAHGELITKMINELNELYMRVKNALKELRG